MRRESELVLAGFPLSPFKGNRGVQELAKFIMQPSRLSPVVIIDGVPPPWGPLLIDELRPPPPLSLGLSATPVPWVDLLAVPAKRRDEAPLTYSVLESLKARCATDGPIKLPD